MVARIARVAGEGITPSQAQVRQDRNRIANHGPAMWTFRTGSAQDAVIRSRCKTNGEFRSEAMAVRTTKITIETEGLLVVRQARTVLSWCPGCKAEVDVVLLGEDTAQLLKGLPTGTLRIWSPSEGPVRICLPSLASAHHPTTLNKFNPERTPGNKGEGQAPYRLVDLGVVGAAGGPNHLANNDISVGSVQSSDGNDHAVIYFGQHIVDISKPGLGGANSLAFGNNPWAEVVGGANIAKVDPKKEDFCGFQALGIATATASCRPFLWWGGHMTAPPTLDDNHGNNGIAAAINDFGEVAGAAENTSPGCPTQNPTASLNQYYQYKPVLWRDHAIEELATVGGDPVGTALASNDNGEAAGMTGTCGAFNLVLAIT